MPNHSFVLNGKPVTVDAPDDMPLLWVLRDMLGVTGPKYGCGVANCGSCTCLLDGDTAILTCSFPVSKAAGHRVTSIEGLATGDVLHPVQEAWIEEDVAQCGYCQPGQILTAVAMLAKEPRPSDDDIDNMQNICRCGTYLRVRAAIKNAAARMG